MNSSKKTATIVFAFFVLTGGLFYMDYVNINGNDKPTFFTSILKNLFNQGSITQETIDETSMKGSTTTSLSKTNDFFSPYLTLPKNVKADRYTIENSSLLIYEVHAKNTYQTVKSLLAQESSKYKFNKINAGTFYLNQIPADKKTHNFLAISINNVLYGFQYNPIDHKKVLELIDALQKTE